MTEQPTAEEEMREFARSLFTPSPADQITLPADDNNPTGDDQ